jgi:hypothetical protein
LRGAEAFPTVESAAADCAGARGIAGGTDGVDWSVDCIGRQFQPCQTCRLCRSDRQELAVIRGKIASSGRLAQSRTSSIGDVPLQSGLAQHPIASPPPDTNAVADRALPARHCMGTPFALVSLHCTHP